MFQDANGQSGQRKTNVTLCMKSAAIILTLRLFAENAEIVGGSRIRDLGTERDRWRDKGKQEKHGIVETGKEWRLAGRAIAIRNLTNRYAQRR